MKKNINRASYQHQESNGYRHHSALKRDVHSWNGLFRFDGNKILKTTFLYGDLFYETPGALTKAEYDVTPKAARPGGGSFPSAEAANASVHQNMFIAGASYEQPLFSKWKNKSVLYGMFTELRNPTVQNYGRSSEPHVGGRTTFQFNQTIQNGKFSFDVGGEWQEGFTNVSIFKNVGGNADSLQTSDEINNRQSFVFMQAMLDVNEWTVQAGGSYNFLRVRFQRFAPASLCKQERIFSNQIAPRLSTCPKDKRHDHLHQCSQRIFAAHDCRISTNRWRREPDLNAEYGINYDVGVKGNLLHNLFMDVNAFSFSLHDAIVQRRTAGGGDYFINAGKTKQYGIETYLS